MGGNQSSLYLVLVQHKILGQYVGVTKALQHCVHEACVSVIPQTGYAGCLIRGPLVSTQRWYTVILLLRNHHRGRGC